MLRSTWTKTQKLSKLCRQRQRASYQVRDHKRLVRDKSAIDMIVRDLISKIIYIKYKRDNLPTIDVIVREQECKGQPSTLSRLIYRQLQGITIKRILCTDQDQTSINNVHRPGENRVKQV